MLPYFPASGDGKSIKFHSWYKDKPASGRATQRKDGIWEHSYERNMTDPYFGVCLPRIPMGIATMRLSQRSIHHTFFLISCCGMHHSVIVYRYDEVLPASIAVAGHDHSDQCYHDDIHCHFQFFGAEDSLALCSATSSWGSLNWLKESQLACIGEAYRSVTMQSCVSSQLYHQCRLTRKSSTQQCLDTQLGQ